MAPQSFPTFASAHSKHTLTQIATSGVILLHSLVWSQEGSKNQHDAAPPITLLDIAGRFLALIWINGESTEENTRLANAFMVMRVLFVHVPFRLSSYLQRQRVSPRSAKAIMISQGQPRDHRPCV